MEIAIDRRAFLEGLADEWQADPRVELVTAVFDDAVGNQYVVKIDPETSKGLREEVFES